MDTVTWRLGVDAALGLANSQHGPGAHYRRRARADEPIHDHLADPDDAASFLGSHAIPAPEALPTEDQLARLRGLRDHIRTLADPTATDEAAWTAVIDEALRPVAFRLRADGTMEAAARGWDAVGDDLLPAALALLRERGRLRTCGNPLCRWLFIDRSRNGSRVWCEMAVCGNRMKVRRHRTADQPLVATAVGERVPTDASQPPR